MRKARNIFWLGNKELRSFARDFFLVAFVIWSFSFSILSQSQGHLQEVHNASIGVVDEDHSALSRQLAHAFLPPEFKTRYWRHFPSLVPAEVFKNSPFTYAKTATKARLQKSQRHRLSFASCHHSSAVGSVPIQITLSVTYGPYIKLRHSADS